MTPKEKAEELWGKYFQLNYDWDGTTKDKWAIDGALIAVDEIVNNNSRIPGLLTQDTMHNTWYWQEVKKELENL